MVDIFQSYPKRSSIDENHCNSSEKTNSFSFGFLLGHLDLEILSIITEQNYQMILISRFSFFFIKPKYKDSNRKREREGRNFIYFDKQYKTILFSI